MESIGDSYFPPHKTCVGERETQRSELGNKGFVAHSTSKTDKPGSIICGYNWLTLRCMYLKSKTAYTPRMGAVGEGLEGLELDQADLEWLSGGGRF